MIVHNLDEMIKGWFVGNFNPTAYETSACEVAIKKYVAGDFELSHFHKVADEITVIVSGRVRMNGCEYEAGNILVIKAGEATDFLAIEDTLSVVIKTPGALNDKYIIG